jgi:hypothetical protein
MLRNIRERLEYPAGSQIGDDARMELLMFIAIIGLPIVLVAAAVKHRG